MHIVQQDREEFFRTLKKGDIFRHPRDTKPNLYVFVGSLSVRRGTDDINANIAYFTGAGWRYVEHCWFALTCSDFLVKV